MGGEGSGTRWELSSLQRITVPCSWSRKIKVLGSFSSQLLERIKQFPPEKDASGSRNWGGQDGALWTVDWQQPSITCTESQPKLKFEKTNRNT